MSRGRGSQYGEGSSANTFGGPHFTDVDNSVLWLQSMHRSNSVWNNEEIKPLACRCYSAWELDIRVKHYVSRAGFVGVSEVAGIRLYTTLIQALVERWRRETHTFHFPQGEMAVTLQDVAMLMGLPIDGKAVTYDQSLSKIDFIKKYKDLLGVVPPEIVVHKKDGTSATIDSSRKNISLLWLRNTFSNPLPNNATDETVRQHARAYILYVIGGILLPTLKGDIISSMYLPLLEDFDVIRTFSWGSACLARLYAGLCSTCCNSSTNMGGCALLLQLWSWERFHVGRPTMSITMDSKVLRNKPLGAYWKGPKTFSRNPRSCLEFYRDEFDLQEHDQVIWVPYQERRVRRADPICNEGNDIWMSRVPLIQFHEVEWHRPDRVMRQFGYPQHIPDTVPREQDDFHGQNRRGCSNKVWANEFINEITLWNNRRMWIVLPRDPAPFREYCNWYCTITRMYISQATNRAARQEQAYMGDLRFHPRGSQNRTVLGGIIQTTLKAARGIQRYNNPQAIEWFQAMEELFVLLGEPEIYTRISERVLPFHDLDD